MLEEFQSAISPVLTVLGDNRYVQAVLVVALSFVAAWLFNLVIITGLKKLALKTRFDLDDHLIRFLHSPIYNSILLLGLASATLILSPPELYLNIIFSLIQSFALIVWVVFLLRTNRLLLTRISKNEKRIIIINKQKIYFMIYFIKFHMIRGIIN